MKARSTLLFVVVSLMLLGCAKGDRLVGTWVGVLPVAGQNAQVTQTFNADKTMNGTFNMEIPQLGKIVIEVAGTWESKSGEEVTSKVTSVKVVEAPAAVRQQIQTQMEKQMQKTESSKLTWNGDDEVVVEGDGNPVTFRRKK
ncbi:MAG: hypothetical protein HZC36_11415 [Armatimonadetes bacterium]|nr:hypothetical protein [Armatimonadota bacterium]